LLNSVILLYFFVRITVFIPAPFVSIGEDMFSIRRVHLSVRLSGQILLAWYLTNGLSSLSETYREYSLASTDDLIRFLRSKVKVTADRRGGECIHVYTGALKYIWLKIGLQCDGIGHCSVTLMIDVYHTTMAVIALTLLAAWQEWQSASKDLLSLSLKQISNGRFGWLTKAEISV